MVRGVQRNRERREVKRKPLARGWTVQLSDDQERYISDEIRACPWKTKANIVRELLDYAIDAKERNGRT